MNDNNEHIPLFIAILVGIIGTFFLAGILIPAYQLLKVIWIYCPWVDILIIVGTVAGIILWYLDKQRLI